MVHAVLIHVHRGLVDVSFAARQANLLIVIEDQQAVAHGLVGFNFEVGIRAFDGAQIAAALFRHILQVRPGGIAVRHADVFHVGKIEHVDVEVFRVKRPGFHVIFDAFRQPAENKLKARAAGLRLHGHLIPLRSALIARVQAHVLRLQADELRRHHQVGIAPHGNVAGDNLNVIKGGRAAVRRCRPKQSSAFAEVSRPGEDQPQENAQRDSANAEKRSEPLIGNKRFRLGGAGYIERIESQQIEKRLAFFRVALGKGHEALLEFGEYVLGLAGRAAAVERDQGKGDAESNSQRQRKQQRHARARDAPARKRQGIGNQYEDNGGGQGDRGEDRGAAKHRAQAQAPLELLNIGVELISKAHKSSCCWAPRYRSASRDSAIAAANTRSIIYHHKR